MPLLADRLATRCSPGGLWGYASFQFSAETSCFAILALAGVLNRTVVEGHLRKLVYCQRADGSWPSTEGGSAGSAWATAIAAVTLLELSPGASSLHSAMKALAHSNPQEAFWLSRRPRPFRPEQIRLGMGAGHRQLGDPDGNGVDRHGSESPAESHPIKRAQAESRSRACDAPRPDVSRRRLERRQQRRIRRSADAPY
jgi:hypothetical protein